VRSSIPTSRTNSSLWLYFNHQRRFCLEMHFATFWGRLQSPDPQEHPHPALLNAIVSQLIYPPPPPDHRV